MVRNEANTDNAHSHTCPNCNCQFASAELITANARIMELQQIICEMNDGEACPVCGSNNTEFIYRGSQHPHNRYGCRDCGWAMIEDDLGAYRNTSWDEDDE